MSDGAAGTAFPLLSYETWRARVAGELSDAGGRAAMAALEGLPVEPLYAADHLADGAPLPALPPAPAAWRSWREVPASAGALGRAALRRERGRDLGGVWLRLDDGAQAAAIAALLGEELHHGDVELGVEWAGEPLAGAALLVAAAQAAGVAAERLAGCLGCDPLGALARCGTLCDSACAQLVGATRWSLAHAPRVRAGLISTAPYADAGADAAQEIAFALATGAEALRWLLETGLAPDAAASQLLVSTTVGRDLYLQLAKLRALRLTWGMLLASVDAPPSTLRLHARTAWRTKGRRDPGTDLVRATVETVAAVLGGCSDVTTSPFLDERLELELGLPLGSATQLLLREEVGLDRVADAAGGSWYVESLTAMLARRAWSLFEGIERRGGMARELAVGAVAQQVAAAADRRRRALEEKRLPVVGVSVHAAKDPVPLPHRPLAAAGHAHGTAAASTAPAERVPPLAGNADSAALFAAAVRAAGRGAAVASLAAALPCGRARLRAPLLAAWRDAEVCEPQETSR
jgi:methylmalonyl-CoA mutase